MTRNADWNQRYRSGDNLDTAPAPLLVRAVRSLPPGKALDLACGAGRNAIFLASRGWRVTAVDLSTVAIDILRQRASEAGVEVEARVADVEAGRFRIEPESYDLICIFYFLHRPLLAKARRGVKPGGYFVGSIHLQDDDPEVKPMNPAYLLNDGDLRRSFRDWEILHDREGKPEEAEHRRRSADIVARKLSS